MFYRGVFCTPKITIFDPIMAKQNFKEQQQQSLRIMSNFKAGKYAPIYLLMGEESYYTDKVANYIATHVLDESQRDFNQVIVYGKDTDGGSISTLAHQYPVMSDRKVIIVREAQTMRNIEALAPYCAKAVATTLLVLCYKGKSLDKRSVLYKNIVKSGGEVLESTTPRDYEMESWIRELFASRGCTIEPKALAMISEHLGCELQKIDNEATKLLTRLPEGTTQITAQIIEQNVGISKEYNNFELTRALSERNARRALQIVDYFAANPKDNPHIVTISTLFNHFQRIVTLGIYKWEQKQKAAAQPSEAEIAQLLKLPSPFFAREYATASANYPNAKVFEILGILRDFDMRSKGLGNGSGEPGELLRELILRIMTI